MSCIGSASRLELRYSADHVDDPHHSLILMIYCVAVIDWPALTRSPISARTGEFFAGPNLPAPHSHPLDQPTPEPAGRVHVNWQTLLHEWLSLRSISLAALSGERAVDLGHDGGSLTHCCGDALRRTRSHVAYRENAGPTGLKRKG